MKFALSTAIAAFALALFASPAAALTLTNKTDKDITIGIDMGKSESVENVAAGKKLSLDQCKDGCGLTGPWGYSRLAVPGEDLAFDGENVVPANGS